MKEKKIHLQRKKKATTTNQKVVLEVSYLQTKITYELQLFYPQTIENTSTQVHKYYKFLPYIIIQILMHFLSYSVSSCHFPVPLVELS